MTAIPTNSILLNRLDEEESVFFEDDETDADNEADARRRQEDEDAKIPLLNADTDQVRAFIICQLHRSVLCPKKI